MEQINLSAQPRPATGKAAAGRLRRDDLVPAILYGQAIKGAISLTLNNKELEKVLHTAAGGNVLVNLDVQGDKLRTVMFKEVSRHPLKGSLQHVDLVEIQMDHKITVDVPVHLVGKAEGVAFGGIVQQEHRTVKIECLPTQIPASIDVDITKLGIGQSLHVSDMKLAEGVEVIDEASTTIVSVVAPTAEVAPKTAEEVEAELAKSFAEKEEEAKEE
ncbi:MAG TPA: 50S ribosomal protein L25 [Thermodesulfobacteriota bacterium]|nr:50S ribosomal protein L25 [Thermodesulfobacteriota bacterium]